MILWRCLLLLVLLPGLACNEIFSYQSQGAPATPDQSVPPRDLRVPGGGTKGGPIAGSLTVYVEEPGQPGSGVPGVGVWVEKADQVTYQLTDLDGVARFVEPRLEHRVRVTLFKQGRVILTFDGLDSAGLTSALPPRGLPGIEQKFLTVAAPTSCIVAGPAGRLGSPTELGWFGLGSLAGCMAPPVRVAFLPAQETAWLVAPVPTEAAFLTAQSVAAIDRSGAFVFGWAEASEPFTLSTQRALVTSETVLVGVELAGSRFGNRERTLLLSGRSTSGASTREFPQPPLTGELEGCAYWAIWSDHRGGHHIRRGLRAGATVAMVAPEPVTVIDKGGTLEIVPPPGTDLLSIRVLPKEAENPLERILPLWVAYLRPAPAPALSTTFALQPPSGVSVSGSLQVEVAAIQAGGQFQLDNMIFGETWPTEVKLSTARLELSL